LEVLKAVTMMNAVFYDVALYGSCKRFLQEPHSATSQKTAFFKSLKKTIHEKIFVVF
jgi:hypothetical protein